MSVDFNEFSRRMDKTLEVLGENFGSVRAGRANAKVLDRISVEYYGQETPLNGVATISSPDARTLVIQPWDGKLLEAKVAMRNIRRDGMDYIKKLKKNSEITEDDQKKAEKDLQDLLDKYIKKVDDVLAAKEKELMAI